MDNTAQAIRTALNTLERIEVRGKANIDYMLGVMILLEKIAAEKEKEAVTDDHD